MEVPVVVGGIQGLEGITTAAGALYGATLAGTGAVATGTGIGAGLATGTGIGAGLATGTAIGAGLATGTAIGTGVAAGTGIGAGVAAGTGIGAGVAAGTGIGAGVAAGTTTTTIATASSFFGPIGWIIGGTILAGVGITTLIVAASGSTPQKACGTGSLQKSPDIRPRGTSYHDNPIQERPCGTGSLQKSPDIRPCGTSYHDNPIQERPCGTGSLQKSPEIRPCGTGSIGKHMLGDSIKPYETGKMAGLPIENESKGICLNLKNNQTESGSNSEPSMPKETHKSWAEIKKTKTSQQGDYVKASSIKKSKDGKEKEGDSYWYKLDRAHAGKPDEIEVFDTKGKHVGVVQPDGGELDTSKAVKGRTIKP